VKIGNGGRDTAPQRSSKGGFSSLLHVFRAVQRPAKNLSTFSVNRFDGRSAAGRLGVIGGIAATSRMGLVCHSASSSRVSLSYFLADGRGIG
jgi:hypothetical protein